jgi:hypothetical protein
MPLPDRQVKRDGHDIQYTLEDSDGPISGAQQLGYYLGETKQLDLFADLRINVAQ